MDDNNYGYRNIDDLGVHCGQRFFEIDNKLDHMGKGLADMGFALDNVVRDSTGAVATALSGEIRDLHHEMDEKFCRLERETHAEGEATRNLIRDNEIQNLRDKNLCLELDKRTGCIPKFTSEFYPHFYPWWGVGGEKTNT